jgi:hypothetical protein
MSSLKYGILGGLAAGIQGDVDRRKERAEEAKRMNMLRFQQDMQRDNLVFQDELARDRRGEEWTREDEQAEAAALAKQNQLTIAGVDGQNRPVYADYTGKLVDVEGNPYSGELYNKGAKPQPEKATKPGWQTYTREDGMRIQYDPNNPQNQIEIGMTGTTRGGSGGLSDSQMLKAETELAEMMRHGVDEDNVDIINVYRRHLGMPPLVPLETDPGKEGGVFGIGRKNPTVEYVPGGFEDGNLPPQQGVQQPASQIPEVLPSSSHAQTNSSPEQSQVGGLMATQDVPSGQEVLPRQSITEHPAMTGSVDPFQAIGKTVGKGAENIVGSVKDTIGTVKNLYDVLSKNEVERLLQIASEAGIPDITPALKDMTVDAAKEIIKIGKWIGSDYGESFQQRANRMGQRQGKPGLEQFIKD